MNVRKVVNGRHVGETFLVEGTIQEVCGDDCLPSIAMQGNWAARNALDIDEYLYEDRPFYYGKIAGLGFIIAEKDLEQS